MNNAQLDLMNYLINSYGDNEHYDKNTRFILGLKKFNRLDSIYYDYLGVYDNDLYKKTLEQMERQRTINSQSIIELDKINQLALSKDVKILYLKGLSLAHELYSPVEARLFGDIDILVDYSDLEKFVSILRELKYLKLRNVQGVDGKYYEEPEGFVDYNIVRNIKSTSLIADIAHLGKQGSNGVNIKLDLHLGLFLKPWYRVVEESKLIINRSIPSNIMGITIETLELHDKLLHLLYHFANETTYDGFVDIVMFQGRVVTKLHQLHDIALLIDKYEGQIDWHQLIERCECFQISQEILFAFQLFSKVYPNRVPKWFSAALQNIKIFKEHNIETKALPLDDAVPILLSLEPDIIIQNELNFLVTDILPKLKNHAARIHKSFLISLSGEINLSGLSKSVELAFQEYFSLLAEQTNLLESTKWDALYEDLRELSAEKQKIHIREKIFESLSASFYVSSKFVKFASCIFFILKDDVFELFFTINESMFDDHIINFLVYKLAEQFNSRSYDHIRNYYEIEKSESEKIMGRLQNKVHVLDYWRQKIGNKTSQVYLPLDRHNNHSLITECIEIDFSDFFVSKVYDFMSQTGKSLDQILYASLGVVFYQYTQNTDIVFGISIKPETGTEIQGFGENIVPLCLELGDDVTINGLMQNVQVLIDEIKKNNSIPFKLVEKELFGDNILSPIIKYSISLSTKTVEMKNELGPIINYVRSPLGVSRHDLHVHISNDGTHVTGFVEYNLSLFEKSTVERFIAHFQEAFRQSIELYHQKIRDVELIGDLEKKNILFDRNNTFKDYEFNFVHRLFENQVERNPNDIALVYENKKITYYELNGQSNKLANYLRKKGVSADVVVGVCLDRSIEMVVGILGIMKSGGAYLPLDPSYPSERIEYMLNDSHVSILLTQENLLGLLPNKRDFEICCLDKDWVKFIDSEKSANLDFPMTAQDLVYVIYTSGSTGKPKGVMNIHKGLTNRLFWMQEEFVLTKSDRVLQKTPFSFDVSVWEFFWPLIRGAQLFICKPNGHLDSKYLVSLIMEEQITIMHFVPSMLQVFLAETGVEGCQSLRYVICSGEPLSKSLKEQFVATLPSKLYNLYGPTEASIDVTFYECEKDNKDYIIPIGYPIANINIYILNSLKKLAPIGIPGEIYIGGVGVARGYMNNIDLTNEKFVNIYIDGIGDQRLYRTGDLARLRNNGQIEYLGRTDNQVKFHGQRIELGEIESVLASHPAVRESVVFLENINENQLLIAYVVLIEEDVQMTINYRTYLRSKLPEYMLPNKFVELKSFPLQPNGKLDRGALKTLLATNERKANDENYISPVTKVEREISEIWSEVLGIKQVGVHDNFFDLGGDSIMLMRVYAKMMDKLQFRGTIIDMFRRPTIFDWVKYFEEPSQKEVMDLSDERQKRSNRIDRDRQRVQRKTFRKK